MSLLEYTCIKGHAILRKDGTCPRCNWRQSPTKDIDMKSKEIELTGKELSQLIFEVLEEGGWGSLDEQWFEPTDEECKCKKYGSCYICDTNALTEALDKVASKIKNLYGISETK